MKTHEVITYSFSELSDTAKERALLDFSQDMEYYNGNENAATLKAFEAIFPVKVRRWEYGFCNSFINFELSGLVCDFTGLRLRKWILNNFYNDLFVPKYLKHVKGQARYSKIQKSNDCVLTGYYIDNVILGPIYEFLKKPGANVTLYDLMQECLNSWLSACQKDYEYEYSNEAIAEIIEVNEYEFLENGKMF